MTLLVGLLVLAGAGLAYQQHLANSGAYSSSSGVTVSAENDVKYACPMLCVELDRPGECPKCGMEMMPVEQVAPTTFTASSPALYTCPMHPHVEQDHDGTCPVCGMELVPKADDASAVDPATQELVAAVKLSPLQAVLADVEPVHPTLQEMSVSVSAIGEVKVPEDRLNSLVSWQAGRVDNLVLRESGSHVAKGAQLFDIYSEELVQAGEEHLLAFDAASQLGEHGYASIASSTERLLNASRQKLTRLGLSDSQITALETTGLTQEHIPIYATHGGIVLEKHITEGMYVKEGSLLYSVADLSEVWVEVEIFERDMASLSIGDLVSMLCPIHPGMSFNGRVELIEPQLDPLTRTHLARVAVANPSFILRPGMVMEAELTVEHGEQLLLPRNAVLHTGDGDLVYVMAGEGLWAPRAVSVGHDFGELVAITHGLAADEAVAGTAVFLLDSEAQLKGIPRPQDMDAGSDATLEPGGEHAGHNQ